MGRWRISITIDEAVAIAMGRVPGVHLIVPPGQPPREPRPPQIHGYTAIATANAPMPIHMTIEDLHEVVKGDPDIVEFWRGHLLAFFEECFPREIIRMLEREGIDPAALLALVPMIRLTAGMADVRGALEQLVRSRATDDPKTGTGAP